MLCKYKEFSDFMSSARCCRRETGSWEGIAQVLVEFKLIPTAAAHSAQIKPLLNEEDLFLRMLSNDCDHCAYEAKLWNGERWFSPFLDFVVNEGISEIQEDGRPSKTVTLNGQLLEFDPASELYNGSAVLLCFVNLLNTYPSICEWIPPPWNWISPGWAILKEPLRITSVKRLTSRKPLWHWTSGSLISKCFLGRAFAQ